MVRSYTRLSAGSVGDRRALLIDLIGGIIVGTVVWMGFVGPALLP